MKLGHFLQQLRFLSLCLTAVIQAESVNSGLEFGDLFELFRLGFLIIGFLFAGFQRFLLHVDQAAILVFHILKRVNLVVDTLFQHIHNIFQNVVQASLHILQLVGHTTGNLPDTLAGAIGKSTKSVDPFKRRLILVFIQPQHCKAGIYITPSGVCRRFRSIKEVVQRCDVILLLSNAQRFNVGERAFNRKLLCTSGDHFLNTLLIDNQLAVLILQVRHIFHAEIDNALKRVYRNVSAFSIFIGGVMQCVIYVLDRIDRFGSLLHDCVQQGKNLCTSSFHTALQFPPTFRTLAVGLVQILQRFDKILCLFPQSIGGLLQSLILALAVCCQFVQVLHITDPELIGISIILNRKAQLTKRLCTSGDGAVSLVVQIVQSFLLTLISINQFVLQHDLLFQIIGVLDFVLNIRDRFLRFPQSFQCFPIIVNRGDILLNFLGRAASTARAFTRTALEFLKWDIFKRLQRGNLTINLTNRFLIGINIQFNLRDIFIQIESMGVIVIL